MDLPKLFTRQVRGFIKIYHHQNVLHRKFNCLPDCTPCDPNKKGLVLGVYECKDKFVLTPNAEAANLKLGGKICEQLTEVACQLRLGKAIAFTNLDPDYSAIALTSFGPKNPGYNQLEDLDESRENTRVGVGAAVRELAARGCGRISVDPAGAADAAAEGAFLTAWRFQEFAQCGKRQPCCLVEPAVLDDSAGGADAGDSDGGPEGPAEWAQGAVLAQAQNWARYLCDMPANKMTPVDFAQATMDCLCPLGVAVEGRDKDWIAAQKMEAILAVSRGSCEPPMFMECVYRGGQPTDRPVLLCAKGVTFDSGGLCLKSAESMARDRGGAAGAAVAVAAMKALAKLKVPINVVLVLPLCENMLSGQAMRPGDVVRALNGTTIQIEDTDKEGRLLLADALVYGQSVHKPSLVIDIATLTKGMHKATGGGAFGCFATSNELWERVRAAGAVTGDRPWRFPLWSYYNRQITNDPAVDLRNKGSSRGTPCVGAAFLRNFICGDWVHMDITGVGRVAGLQQRAYLESGLSTGRPTRTLVALLRGLAQTDRDDTGEPAEKEK